MESILGGLFIFVLRLCDVSLGTLRILMTVRGRKVYAAGIGFVEVTIFVVAISQVVSNIGNLWNVIGYAGGFSAGTVIGITLEQRLAMGFVIVRVISSKLGKEIGEAIRQAGYGVTELIGRGMRDSVVILEVVARRHELPRVRRIVDQVDSKAFITVEETQHVYRGWRLGK